MRKWNESDGCELFSLNPDYAATRSLRGNSQIHLKRISNNCSTKEANSAMNQSELNAVTHKLLKDREKSCVQGAIAMGSASRRLTRGF